MTPRVPRLFGNAPCSWGMLEFENASACEPIGYAQMLDELAASGYTGTELGDWDYMPPQPAALREELLRRGLTMTGAFVPVALKDAKAHEAGVEAAVKTATLLAAVAGSPEPFLVLADNNGCDPVRTTLAGRVPASSGLSEADWDVFAAGANRIARAVLERTGLSTVFHHHCAGYVETPAEIATLLERTDPSLLGLVFDAGHFLYGAGAEGADMMQFLRAHQDRIWYYHAKDCLPGVAAQARAEEWDYFTALRHGVFCELGRGAVDFHALLAWLDTTGYSGYLTVEQDVLPGMGAPRESAQRNLDYLKQIDGALEPAAAAQGDTRP
jgi:inosose dehydratase